MEEIKFDDDDDIDKERTINSVKSHIESDYKNFDYDKNESNIKSIIEKLLDNDHIVKTKDIYEQIKDVDITNEDQRNNMYKIIKEEDTEIYNQINTLEFIQE